MNQVEIPEVYDETAPLSENEHRVLFKYGIDEKHPAAADAEIPEGERNYAFASSFARNPLDQKSAEKQSLAAEPENEQIIVDKIPDHVVHRITHAFVLPFGLGAKASKRDNPGGLQAFRVVPVTVRG